MRYGAIALAIAWLGTGQCGSRPSDGEAALQTSPLESTSVAIQEIITQAVSGLSTRRRMVIREPAGWAELWGEAMANRTPAPEAPTVDFDRFMVIVVSMGSRRTGGYAISVDGIDRQRDRLVVTVLEVEPGPGCVTTQAFTSPWTAVRIPATEGPVTFVERQETAQCRRAD
jgi:hypothetical protein